MRRRLAVSVMVALVAIASAACGGAPEEFASDDFAEVPGIGSTRIDVPRPTGPADAGCGDDPLPPTTDETIVERVAALRAIGLFADRVGVTDEALAVEIDADLVAAWGDAEVDDARSTIPGDDPLMDLLVAQQDLRRVWWSDLEADVAAGNDVYADTLTGWGAISLDAFVPEAIEETWVGDAGPVTVEFDLAGSPQTLRPAYLEDWIDPGIIVPINEMIAGSGRRFELYKAFDQTAFVMALTESERTAFERRGWCFE